MDKMASMSERRNSIRRRIENIRCHRNGRHSDDSPLRLCNRGTSLFPRCFPLGGRRMGSGEWGVGGDHVLAILDIICFVDMRPQAAVPAL